MRIRKTSQYMEGGATLSNEYGTSQVNGYTQDYFNIDDFTTYTSSDFSITSGTIASSTSLKIGLNNDKTLAIIAGIIQCTKTNPTESITLQTDIRPTTEISLDLVLQRTASNNMLLLRTAKISTTGLMTIRSSDLAGEIQLFFIGYPIMLKAFENIS